ncbi:Hypp3223 [Branchiostoma lanceolatum]|uniref:Hypp3223 protein n=1 Tax=Branchiostoma lanceolatum TaxID=7740 RepID=A0A8K0EWX9_BRALA|nr:Hypp3223 [Branchiostoma lanceolatum]
MKAFVIFALLAFCGGSQASLLDELAAAATAAFQGVIDTAQQTAQNLVDTYVPVLGQAAQQLVGEAIQSAGESLTGLISGGSKRQAATLQTEIGQIIHDGIMGVLEGATTAIQNVQNTVTQTVQNLFGSDPAPATRGSLIRMSIKGKMNIKKAGQKMMKTLNYAISKKTRGFFDSLASGVSTIFQPAIDQASAIFNNLVDTATQAGQQILDHGSNLVNNVSAQLQQTYQDILDVATPYVDDAQTIVASIQNQFQQTFGDDTTA